MNLPSAFSDCRLYFQKASITAQIHAGQALEFAPPESFPRCGNSRQAVKKIGPTPRSGAGVTWHRILPPFGAPWSKNRKVATPGLCSIN